MATAICLAPAFHKFDPNWLKGELWAPGSGNTRVDMIYKNIPGKKNADEARDKLDVTMRYYLNLGPIIVCGHSMGAQIIAKWLRDLGMDSDIDPADVTFYLTGNLERRYNGYPKGGDYPGWDEQPPEGRYETDPGGSGVPIDTPYTVFDIAKQWDGWADNPTDTTNSIAMTNNFWGRWGSGTPHGKYEDVSLDDPDLLFFEEYNITYVLAPTGILPYCQALYASIAEQVSNTIELLTTVETSFVRPYAGEPVLPDPPPPPPIPVFPADIPIDHGFVDRRVYDLVGDDL